MEAQAAAIREFLASVSGARVVAEYVEVESGRRVDRRELAKAIEACRIYGARLVIARLDRLARNAHFLLGLAEAGIDFVACDLPHANRMTVGIMAIVAEEERRMISARTKAALQAAKARGVALGGWRGVTTLDDEARARAKAVRTARAQARAHALGPLISEIRRCGYTSLRAIAAALVDRGIPAPRGAKWSATSVRAVLLRLHEAE